jgi:hypothetical protein
MFDGESIIGDMILKYRLMSENFSKDRDGFLKMNPNLTTDDTLVNFQNKSSVIFPYIDDGDIFE